MKSKEYFDGISNEWDEIRQSFFSDSIREKMCEAAQVKEGARQLMSVQAPAL